MNCPSRWTLALESLTEYSRGAFNLPEDNSLISPIARVITQKRRLMKIHEIHNLMIEAAETKPREMEKEILYLKKFRNTFTPGSVHKNQFSVSESFALSSLIVDTLKRCSAEEQMINLFLREAFAEVNSGKSGTVVRAGLILLRSILESFPKQANYWSNDILKSILTLFKTFSQSTSKSSFDCVLESLKCLEIILRSPSKFMDAKERENVLIEVEKYLKAKSLFIAIEASKVFEAYFEGKEQDILHKKDVKMILGLLNGNLSARLRSKNCSTKLLEFCFSFNEFNKENSFIKGSLSVASLEKNIDRVLGFKEIDLKFFADALANVLINLRYDHEKIIKILWYLKTKSFVTAKCFGMLFKFLVERQELYTDSIKLIRIVHEKFILSAPNKFSVNFLIKVIEVLVDGLYKKYPESLTEVDFSAFTPLIIPETSLQVKSVELICKVLEDKPIALSNQVTLLFAQLKGDFLRLKMEETNVLREAVRGLLKLFAAVLNCSLSNYSNYCDQEVLARIREWNLEQLLMTDDWLKNEPEIVRGVLLLAAVLNSYDMDNSKVQLNGSTYNSQSELNESIALSHSKSQSIIGRVVEFSNNPSIDFTLYCNHLLSFFGCVIEKNSQLYSLYHGSIDKCFHHLNSISHPNVKDNSSKTFLLNQPKKFQIIFKLIVESKSNFNSVALVCYLAKLIAFSSFNLSDEFADDFDLINENSKVNLISFSEYFAKLFWRNSQETQNYSLSLWISGLKNKSVSEPSQILTGLKAVLECSELFTVDTDHRNKLISQSQDIVKEFLLVDDFNVRVECGLVLGSIVRLLQGQGKGLCDSDFSAVDDLFGQFMKHSMKTNENNLKDQKPRVCYIIGLVMMKANLKNLNDRKLELSSNALLGLLASWTREDDRIHGQEIAAAAISALAYFIEHCGSQVNSEFYQDSCELLLEQIFMKNRSELMIGSVKFLAKSLALFVNLLPSQSQFIKKTVRLVLESCYLDFYGTEEIDLMVEISKFNPQITRPSKLIYQLLEKNIFDVRKGSIGGVCRYLCLQIGYEPEISFQFIDSGIVLNLLERFNVPENLENDCLEAFSELFDEIIQLTIVQRFYFWINLIFSPMNFGGVERSRASSLLVEDLDENKVYDSASSIAPQRSGSNVNLCSNVIFMLMRPLSRNIYQLINLPKDQLKIFLDFAIRISFNIVSEKINQRNFFLVGISLLKEIINSFSELKDQSGSYVLEQFDSQIISIISSAIRFSEEGDPFYGACAYSSLLKFISNRLDVQEEIKAGNGRIVLILKKSLVIFKEQEIFWSIEVVDNLVCLEIVIGVCSLLKSSFNFVDLANILYNEDLEVSLDNVVSIFTLSLKSHLEGYFIFHAIGKLEKNIQLAISGNEKILMLETWLKLEENEKCSKPEVLNGVMEIISGITTENYEQIFNLSLKLFGLNFFLNFTSSNNNLTILNNLSKLLKRIINFGIEKKDPLCIECILPLLSHEKSSLLSLAREAIKKLTEEFLTTKFSDFDARFGVLLLNSENLIIYEEAAEREDIDRIFAIIKKLIDVCINDLEVNNCQEVLKCLKTIFSDSENECSDNKCLNLSKFEKFKTNSNELLTNWIKKLNEVNSSSSSSSNFLNQLVFFCFSINPNLWTLETLNILEKYYRKLIQNLNTIEMALNYWILLLKSRSKLRNGSDDLLFLNFFKCITRMVEDSFESYRGTEIDLIWERIFGIAQSICVDESSLKFISHALGELNDFK